VDAVLDDCHPEMYTVSRYFAIWVIWIGSSLDDIEWFVPYWPKVITYAPYV
jgi:hypothetical protein